MEKDHNLVRIELMKLMLYADSIQSSLDPTKYIVQVDEFAKPGFHWKSLVELEKEMRVRAKECRDCGSPYEDQPFETGNYEMDNEPMTRTNETTNTIPKC